MADRRSPGAASSRVGRSAPDWIWTTVLGLIAVVAIGILITLVMRSGHHAGGQPPAGEPQRPDVSAPVSTASPATGHPADDQPTPAEDEPAPVPDEPLTIEEAGDRCAGGDAAGCEALADTCTSGNLLACDVLWAASPVGSSYEAFGNSCGDRIDMDFQGGCDAFLEAGGGCQDGVISDCDDLAGACDDGDMVACDVLYVTSPPGSGYEHFGATCGDRVGTSAAGSCLDID